MKPNWLSDNFAVCAQITAADMQSIRAAGFDLLVNNRPDGEAPGQPDSNSLETAARTAGVDYLALPMGAAGASMADIKALAARIAAGGQILAFCRSGGRSALLWALASATRGESADALIAQARAAGQDLRMLQPILERLAQENS